MADESNVIYVILPGHIRDAMVIAVAWGVVVPSAYEAQAACESLVRSGLFVPHETHAGWYRPTEYVGQWLAASKLPDRPCMAGASGGNVA